MRHPDRFKIFRQLRGAGGGTVTFDADQQSMTFTALIPLTRSGYCAD